MNYFGVRLKYLRMQDKLTQTELGNALEIAKSTISMYESGKREPDFETIEKFADYFNVDMATFFPSGEIEKTADPKAGGGESLEDIIPGRPLEARLMELVRRLTDDQKKMLLAQIELLLSKQE